MLISDRRVTTNQPGSVFSRRVFNFLTWHFLTFVFWMSDWQNWSDWSLCFGNAHVLRIRCSLPFCSHSLPLRWMYRVCVWHCHHGHSRWWRLFFNSDPVLPDLHAAYHYTIYYLCTWCRNVKEISNLRIHWMESYLNVEYTVIYKCISKFACLQWL